MRSVILSLFLTLLSGQVLNAQQTPSTTPGQVPIPGKPVYIKATNSLWVFSFSKNLQADNKLSYIDLNKSFNVLKPPVYVIRYFPTSKTLFFDLLFHYSVDMSSLITNTQCPVMHFAQAMPDKDGLSVNIFGAGSDINGNYLPSMALCQFNTKTSS